MRLRGGRLDTAAVAGTTPRGSSAAHGSDARAGAVASPKERGEHALVVDDIVHRLASLCDGVAAEAGAPGAHDGDAAASPDTDPRAAPPGTRAARRGGRPPPDRIDLRRSARRRAGTLAARERITRGWYAGGVGWLDASGGEVVVAIRSALLRGTTRSSMPGAGIVAGSVWDTELEETRLKMRPLLAALLEL